MDLWIKGRVMYSWIGSNKNLNFKRQNHVIFPRRFTPKNQYLSHTLVHLCLSSQDVNPRLHFEMTPGKICISVTLLPIRPLRKCASVPLMCERAQSRSWASGLWLQKCGNWFGQMYWVRLWNNRRTGRERNGKKERHAERGTEEGHDGDRGVFMGSHVDCGEGSVRRSLCSASLLSRLCLLGGSYCSFFHPEWK